MSFSYISQKNNTTTTTTSRSTNMYNITSTTTYTSNSTKQNTFRHHRYPKRSNNNRFPHNNNFNNHTNTNNNNNNKNTPHSNSFIGSLKWYNAQKEYGFIGYDDYDIFVHKSAFNSPSIRNNHDIINLIGQKLRFNIEEYSTNTCKYSLKTKQKAINVIPIHHQNNNNNNNQINNKQVAQHRGTLLWFNDIQKYGFIKCSDDVKYNADDIFVYESELKFAKHLIYKGQKLKFNIEEYKSSKSNKIVKKAINVAVDYDEYISDDNIINPNDDDDDDNVSLSSWTSLTSSTSNTASTTCSYSATATATSNNYNNININDNNSNQKYRGTLLWFNYDQQFGFIKVDNDLYRKEVFVYSSDFNFSKDLIYKDQRLMFNIKLYRNKLHGRHRAKAIDVIIETHAQQQRNTHNNNNNINNINNDNSFKKNTFLTRCKSSGFTAKYQRVTYSSKPKQNPVIPIIPINPINQQNHSQNDYGINNNSDDQTPKPKHQPKHKYKHTSRNKIIPIRLDSHSNRNRVISIYTWGNTLRSRPPKKSLFDLNISDIDNEPIIFIIPNLDKLTGKDERIQKHIKSGNNFQKYFDTLINTIIVNKIHSVSVNDRNGKHRSVAFAELIKNEILNKYNNNNNVNYCVDIINLEILGIPEDEEEKEDKPQHLQHDTDNDDDDDKDNNDNNDDTIVSIKAHKKRR